MIGVRIVAPAKVNLGLAVVGKRPDGYHNIDTIMAMIDLADVITIRHSETDSITIHGMDDIPPELNLITRAIRAWCLRSGVPPSFDVHVHKRIPSPAGLGGASSNAAATLRALNHLSPGASSSRDLVDLAASLGADCPFFLGTPAARARGTGNLLTPVSPMAGWVVIVVPPSVMIAKTATLYASLTPNDYLGSEHIDRIEQGFATDSSPQLANSFSRTAREHVPTIDFASTALAQVAGTWALSGAGPAVYARARTAAEADVWSRTLRTMLPKDYAVITSRLIDTVPGPEWVP